MGNQTIKENQHTPKKKKKSGKNRKRAWQQHSIKSIKDGKKREIRARYFVVVYNIYYIYIYIWRALQ